MASAALGVIEVESALYKGRWERNYRSLVDLAGLVQGSG